MKPNRRRTVVVLAVTAATSVLGTLLPISLAAAEESPAEPVEVPGTDLALDPLAPGSDQAVEMKDQPDVSQLPHWDELCENLHWFGATEGTCFASPVSGFARPSPGSSTIRRVGVTTGGHDPGSNGAAFVYVSAGGSNRVQVFDAVNLGFRRSFGPSGAGGSAGEAWDSLQSISYWRPETWENDTQGEVFVLGKVGGKQQIRVFDEAGGFKRTLPVPLDLLESLNLIGPFQGMDASFGELWLTTTPAGNGTADVLGQSVVVLDSLTGAFKGLGRQPLDDATTSTTARSWWDMSIAPEFQAGIVDRNLFQRGTLLPGVAMIGSPLCLARIFYACASINQRGTDAVAGMRWYMELASYAEMGTNRPIQEYSIDKRGTTIDASLINDLLGEPLEIACGTEDSSGSSGVTLCYPGYYLTPKRSWESRQQNPLGDTFTVSDLAYNNRDARIDWYGLLKSDNWLRGQKCVGYIVSQADIYVVGDRGERWFELVDPDNFDRIEMFVDGNRVDYSEVAAGHDLCFDTTQFEDGDHHTLELKTTLLDGRTLRVENPQLRIDNTPPNQSVEPLPRFIRRTLPVKGTTADAPAGLRDWVTEVRPAGASPGNWVRLPDGPDPATGAPERCSDLKPVRDSQVSVNCPWVTNAAANNQSLYPDGPYEVRLRSRDWSSDNPPPPDDAEMRIFGTRNDEADDGNEAVFPRSTTVDNTPPWFSLGGDFWERRDFAPIYDDERPVLTIDAHDVSATDPGSGVTSIQVFVDGISIDRRPKDCPDGGCSLWHSYSFNPTQFTDGRHTVEVVVTDQVGHTTPVSWTIDLEHSGPSASAQSQAAAAALPSLAGSSVSAMGLNDLPGDDAHDLLDCTGIEQPANFSFYSLGPVWEEESLPLREVVRRCDPPDLLSGEQIRANYVSHIYGDCAPPLYTDSETGEEYWEGGCAPPIEIQTWPVCERSLADYELEPGVPYPSESLGEIQGVPAFGFYDGEFLDRVELYSGASTVVIFGTDPQKILAAAADVQPVPAGQPPSESSLPAPMGELADPVVGSLRGIATCFATDVNSDLIELRR
jgi:hypothetical protein